MLIVLGIVGLGTASHAGFFTYTGNGEVRLYQSLGPGIIIPTHGCYFLYISPGPGDVGADGYPDYVGVKIRPFGVKSGITHLSFDFNILTNKAPRNATVEAKLSLSGSSRTTGIQPCLLRFRNGLIAYRDDEKGFCRFVRNRDALNWIPVPGGIYTDTGSHYTKQTGWHRVVMDISQTAGLGIACYLEFYVIEEESDPLLDTALLIDNIRLAPAEVLETQ